MRKLRIGLSAATVVALLSTCSFAQFRTVTVQNLPGNPVPTTVTNTPTVNVSGTVPVTVNNTGINPVPVAGNVGITGTPVVTISGTPTVNAGNLPLTNNGGTANGASGDQKCGRAGAESFPNLFALLIYQRDQLHGKLCGPCRQRVRD